MTIKLTRGEVEKILEDSIKGVTEGTQFRWSEEYADGSGTAEVDWKFVEFEGNLGDLVA